MISKLMALCFGMTHKAISPGLTEKIRRYVVPLPNDSLMLLIAGL